MTPLFRPLPLTPPLAAAKLSCGYPNPPEEVPRGPAPTDFDPVRPPYTLATPRDARQPQVQVHPLEAPVPVPDLRPIHPRLTLRHPLPGTPAVYLDRVALGEMSFAEHERLLRVFSDWPVDLLETGLREELLDLLAAREPLPPLTLETVRMIQQQGGKA